MEAETLCRRSSSGNYGRRNVPAMARKAADWGLVSKHGSARVDWTFLRNGDCQINTLLHNGLHGTAWLMAVSESIRGCGLL